MTCTTFQTGLSAPLPSSKGKALVWARDAIDGYRVVIKALQADLRAISDPPRKLIEEVDAVPNR